MSLCNNKSVNYLSKIFHKNLFSWKKKIKLNIKGLQVQAKIDKVEPNGLIKIEFENGKMKHYQAKEIKIIY
jgi:biotin-(acetyl-CoA carboxylase) ligase